MNRQSVVVCVTDQQSCVRLIHEGSRISREKDLDLHVLSVVPLKMAPAVRPRPWNTFFPPLGTWVRR